MTNEQHDPSAQRDGPDVSTSPGTLIINADDWGRDRENTDRTLECYRVGAISSVSAMVFMTDSERAAYLARERGIDAGLHLNFTTPFCAPGASHLLQHLQRTSAYLQASRLTQVIFHPGLAESFEYLAAAQRDEFCRLYGTEAPRYDGHHHMHLCANALFGNAIPSGSIVRRSFSFRPREKGLVNYLYRRSIDTILMRKYRVTDFFFSLLPFTPEMRVRRICELAERSVVEVETHPVTEPEYNFLAGGGIFNLIGRDRIARQFVANSRFREM